MKAVIDRAIESLEELGEYLTDEVVEETVDQRLTARGKACKEAQLSIQVLAMKLQALREAGRPIVTRQLELRGCEVCD
jgi:hypothetical protein